MREDFASVEAFYRADPRRERSGEVDFGVMWTDGGLSWPHYRVSWVEETGEFYAVRLHAGGKGPVEVLGHAAGREAAEAALVGWAEPDVRELAWVRSRLYGVVVGNADPDSRIAVSDDGGETWQIPSPLSGEWTPKRVLHLALAAEIEALCAVLNALPRFRPSGGSTRADDPDAQWVRFDREDWEALEPLREHARRGYVVPVKS